MTLLYQGDCNELMNEIPDNSVDLIFTDLPYGQVSCEWDKKIDFPAMWEQFMRIKKLNAPIFFCCTTKFGADIINSAPKKCPFRYDIVWVKSAPAGFLQAKKMPMRKHEMLYVFYEKLPFYDLSSHSHKFIKEVPTKRAGKDGVDNKGMIKNRCKSGMETQVSQTCLGRQGRRYAERPPQDRLWRQYPFPSEGSEERRIHLRSAPTE